jgi:hypothetical protein
VREPTSRFRFRESAGITLYCRQHFVRG